MTVVEGQWAESVQWPVARVTVGQWAESLRCSGCSHCGSVGGVTAVTMVEGAVGGVSAMTSGQSHHWVSGRSHLGSMLDSSRSALVFSTVS